MPSEFRLELMQPPFDMVGAREALRWLREDFAAYHAVVVHGFFLDDPEDRDAYQLRA